MSNITYLKVTTASRNCRSCQGIGHYYSKEHHNQLKKRVCYICSGTGQESFSTNEDATEKVLQLRATLQDNFIKLNELINKINDLEIRLKSLTSTSHQ